MRDTIMPSLPAAPSKLILIQIVAQEPRVEP